MPGDGQEDVATGLSPHHIVGGTDGTYGFKIQIGVSESTKESTNFSTYQKTAKLNRPFSPILLLQRCGSKVAAIPLMHSRMKIIIRDPTDFESHLHKHFL